MNTKILDKLLILSAFSRNVSKISCMHIVVKQYYENK